MINDQESWWAALNANFENIVAILHRFLPMEDPAHTGPGDAETPLRTDSLGSTISGTRDFNEAARDKDALRTLAYLKGAWRCAPDKPWIHSLPSWGVLCDLCSEDWVFYEEEQ